MNIEKLRELLRESPSHALVHRDDLGALLDVVEAAERLKEANYDPIGRTDTARDYMMSLQSREDELWDALERLNQSGEAT